MVSAGGGDLDGGAGRVLAYDVGEVVAAVVASADGVHAGGGSGAGEAESGEGRVGPAGGVGFLLGYGFVGQDGDELTEAADAEDGDAGHQ